MYEWKVTIILKSGNILKGIYKTDKHNSAQVAKEMLPNTNSNSVTGFASEDGKENIFFILSEVAAFTIGV